MDNLQNELKRKSEQEEREHEKLKKDIKKWRDRIKRTKDVNWIYGDIEGLMKKKESKRKKEM